MGPLGAQPSVIFGDLFVQSPIVAWLGSFFYRTLWFPVALVGLFEARAARRMGIGLLPTFLVIAAVGYVIYFWLPLIGPLAYWGSAFPYQAVPELPMDPRSTMPSLHLAWALMAFLATRNLHRIVRLIAGAWLFGTFVGTLGLGAHYLTDLVVAVPFVLLIRAMTSVELPWSDHRRLVALATGGGLCSSGVWRCVARSRDQRC